MESRSETEQVRGFIARLASLCTPEEPCIDVFLTPDKLALVDAARDEPWFIELTQLLYQKNYGVVLKREPF